MRCSAENILQLCFYEKDLTSDSNSQAVLTQDWQSSLTSVLSDKVLSNQSSPSGF